MFPRIETEKKGTKYYYIINRYEEKLASELKVSKKKIQDRVRSFIDELDRKKVQPQIIDICRSRNSGYTPESQWGIY